MKRLGQAVKSRRDDLRLSQRAVGQAGGPSNSVMTTIENGVDAPIAPSTFSKLDAALQWEPGSARRVYEDGGEPIELAGGGPSQSGSILSGPSGPLPTGRSQPGASAFSESDQQRLLRGADAVGNALNNPDDPANLARIRASFRENIGRHGVTPDLVRTVAAGHLSAVVSQLDGRRRDQVVELAYQLLDEKEVEDGDVNSFGKTERSEVSDLAARRDSNSEVRSIRAVVDDDDPTAGIDWRDYAAHPRTEPLEEDNPTP